MNPLIPPTTPTTLILPLNQLYSHCNRLLNSLVDVNLGQKERILYEQTLWNEVKKIKSSSDQSVFLYLTGFYLTILFQTSNLNDKNDFFQYNVLIRLGDLSRYMKRLDVAEYYYCNARNQFPNFGHAYNQLGLLTKPNNCYKSCYYYVRAARSIEKPLNSIADSNLRIAITKYDCEIVNRILDSQSQETTASSNDKLCCKLPTSAFEWFYVIVVAIHADNMAPPAKHFLQFLNENFYTQKSTLIRDDVRLSTVYCALDSYLMLATLDIMLDWLKLGSRSKEICTNVSPELRQIKGSLQKVIASCIEPDKSIIIKQNHTQIDPLYESNASNNMNLSDGNMHDSSYTSASRSSIVSTPSPSASKRKSSALPHDYVLKGFGPLQPIHKFIVFSNDHLKCKTNFESTIELEDRQVPSKEKFISSEQLVQISKRIVCKMDSFGSLIRKPTRNIALESILSKITNDDGP